MSSLRLSGTRRQLIAADSIVIPAATLAAERIHELRLAPGAIVAAEGAVEIRRPRWRRRGCRASALHLRIERPRDLIAHVFEMKRRHPLGLPGERGANVVIERAQFPLEHRTRIARRRLARANAIAQGIDVGALEIAAVRIDRNSRRACRRQLAPDAMTQVAKELERLVGGLAVERRLLDEASQPR